MLKDVGSRRLFKITRMECLVENGKPEEIAKKVETLITNPSLREKIGKNAVNYVKEHLSWEKYAKTMEEVFERVIKNN